MRENTLKTLIQSGGHAVNGWLGIPSTVSAENMATAGWDSLTVDMQHGLVDYADMVSMVQVISNQGTTPIVRVPWNEQGIIGKTLDAGAYGIICPMINTVEEAEALVRSCRYAPVGERSFGPTRAIWWAGGDYAQHANDTVLVIPMIETRTAVSNVEAIMAVDGIDACYIGPSDLGLSHGFVPKLDREEPELLEIIEKILNASKAAGKWAGIHCATAAYARRMYAKGFSLATIGADNLLLNVAARNAVAEAKQTEAGDSGGVY